ncbi:MAG: cupin domain-containing protein [Planctomycetota bacterium JB042]
MDHDLKAHDPRETMSGPPMFETDDREASFWRLGSFDGGMAWVGRWRGTSPWERHDAGDEVLHVLEGEVEVTVLTDDEEVTTRVPAGSVFVVPRGRWHRQSSAGFVVQWGATPGTTEHSDADDPR